MLEILKRTERQLASSVDKSSADSAVQDCVVDWEIGEEVPFVEVGGPNKKIELSPGLLAHPPQKTPQPPHVEVSKPSVLLTPAQPMSVAYAALVPAAPAISAEVIAYHQPQHATSKEYADLLEAMLANVTADGARALLLVGMKAHVGVSTVLLNLAVIAAQARKMRVALVEATGKNTLGARLGHDATAGLCDVAAGMVGVEQAMIKTCIESLHILPAGIRTVPLSAAAMTWLFAWLHERYDLVLIDGPALGDAANLAVLAPNAHGVYLVLPQGESCGTEAAHLIRRHGGHLCGLIHTQFKV
jgi:Mrp family chromosome partitioning ATPase